MVLKVWSRDPGGSHDLLGDIQDKKYFHNNIKKRFAFLILIFLECGVEVSEAVRCMISQQTEKKVYETFVS